MDKKEIAHLHEVQMKLLSKRDFILERITECKNEYDESDSEEWRKFITEQLEDFLIKLGKLKQLISQMEDAMCVLNRSSHEAEIMLKQIEELEKNLKPNKSLQFDSTTIIKRRA